MARMSIPRVLVRTSISGGDVSGDDVPFRVGDTIYRMASAAKRLGGLNTLFLIISAHIF